MVGPLGVCSGVYHIAYRVMSATRASVIHTTNNAAASRCHCGPGGCCSDEACGASSSELDEDGTGAPRLCEKRRTMTI